MRKPIDICDGLTHRMLATNEDIILHPLSGMPESRKVAQSRR